MPDRDILTALIALVREAERHPDFAALPDWAKAAVLGPVLADAYRSGPTAAADTERRWGRRRTDRPPRDAEPVTTPATPNQPRRRWWHAITGAGE